mmetsp:Transcript_10386/g.31278  ORF Transcript_10386/g.31278 Transcript_10386/m.31278 type:complete len:420 (-) Transcript_10386:692-1951(-)
MRMVLSATPPSQTGELCCSRWPSLCPTTPAAPSRPWQPRQLRRNASGRPTRRRSAAQLLHQPPPQQPRAAARRRRAASDTVTVSAASGSLAVSAVFNASLASTSRQRGPGVIDSSTAALAADFGTQVVSFSRIGPLAGKQLRGWAASVPVTSGRGPSVVASRRSTVVAAYAGSGGSGMGGGTTVVYEYVVTFRERKELNEGEALEALETLWAMQYRLPGCMFAASGAINNKLGHTPGATHALHMRFYTQAQAVAFREHELVKDAFERFINPSFKDVVEIILETKIAKDIDAIFRKGSQWEEGAEHLLLLAPTPAFPAGAGEPFLARLAQLAQQSSGRALQACWGRIVWQRGETQGAEWALLARFPTAAQLQWFIATPPYAALLASDARLPVTAPLSVTFELFAPEKQQTRVAPLHVTDI